MPPPVNTSSFGNMQVMQRLLNKKMCVFVGKTQIVVVVENVKIYTTLCLNDSSLESNRLLFAHIQSLGYSKQISPYFVLK